MNAQNQPQNITVTSPTTKPARKPRAGKMIQPQPTVVLDMVPVPTVTMPVQSQIVIDSGVPVPARTRKALYPWKEMQVGQSFFVPGKKTKSLASGAAVHGKNLGVKFTVKAWLREENGTRTEGARVWRIQ